MVQKVDQIWMNGKFVPWDEAQVHIMTFTLHYGLGCFEGIRYYKNKDGKPAIFRHREHIERLFESAHILQMEIPFSIDELMEAQRELIRINHVESGYLRPLVYMAEGAVGLAAKNDIRVAIITFPWGSYLGDEGIKNGIRTKISSYQRHHVNAMMTKSKAVGNYINSILAKHEALNAGYEEAILMDVDGYISECSGENLFMVRKGIVKTAPIGTILEGITRDSCIRILRDQGYQVVEERFTRDELWLADEIFLTGTAAEVTPVREVDDRKIGTGKPGEVTKKVQDIFFRTVKGEENQYAEWLDPIS